MLEFVIKDWVLPHHNPASGFVQLPPGFSPVEHPLRDEFWGAQAIAVEDVNIPVLVCARFSDHGVQR